MLDWAGWGQTRKTRSRYASLAAVLRVQERLIFVRLAGQLLPLLRSKDRPLLNVFLSLHPAIQIPLQVYDGFANIYQIFMSLLSMSLVVAAN